MNLKNLFQMECKIEEWISHFHLEANTPLHIAEQMLCQFLQAIGKFREQAKAQQEAAKAEEDKSKVEPIPENQPAE